MFNQSSRVRKLQLSNPEMSDAENQCLCGFEGAEFEGSSNMPRGEFIPKLTVANIWEAQERVTTSKSKLKTNGSAPDNGCECRERRRAAADFRPEQDTEPLSNTDMGPRAAARVELRQDPRSSQVRLSKLPRIADPEKRLPTP